MLLYDRNFSVVQDLDWRARIEHQYRCASDAAERGDYPDTCVHLGSVVEGVIASYLNQLQSEKKLNAPLPEHFLDRPNFNLGIQILLKENIIREEEQNRVLNYIRQNRNNHLHTKNAASDGADAQADVKLTLAALDQLLCSLEQHRKRLGKSPLEAIESRVALVSRDLGFIPGVSMTQTSGPIWILPTPLETLEATVAIMRHGIQLFRVHKKQVGLKRMMATEFTWPSYERFFHAEPKKNERLKFLIEEYHQLMTEYVALDQLYDWSIYGTVSSVNCNKATVEFVSKMFFSQRQELSKLGADTYVNHVSMLMVGSVHDQHVYHRTYGLLYFGDEMFHRPYSALLIADERVLSLLDSCYWVPLVRKAFGAGAFEDTSVLDEDEAKKAKILEVIQRGV